MSHVDCPQCHRQCVPRLWHYSPFWGGAIRYSKIQHLCPFCGCCMYETGGSITLMGWVWLYFGNSALSILLIMLMPRLGPVLAEVMSIALTGLIGYKIYQYLKGKFFGR